MNEHQVVQPEMLRFLKPTPNHLLDVRHDAFICHRRIASSEVQVDLLFGFKPKRLAVQFPIPETTLNHETSPDNSLSRVKRAAGGKRIPMDEGRGILPGVCQPSRASKPGADSNRMPDAGIRGSPGSERRSERGSSPASAARP